MVITGRKVNRAAVPASESAWEGISACWWRHHQSAHEKVMQGPRIALCCGLIVAYNALSCILSDAIKTPGLNHPGFFEETDLDSPFSAPEVMKQPTACKTVYTSYLLYVNRIVYTNLSRMGRQSLRGSYDQPDYPYRV